MKLKLLLLYSIHSTYGRIQMTEMTKSLKKTCMCRGVRRGRNDEGRDRMEEGGGRVHEGIWRGVSGGRRVLRDQRLPVVLLANHFYRDSSR